MNRNMRNTVDLIWKLLNLYLKINLNSAKMLAQELMKNMEPYSVVILLSLSRLKNTVECSNNLLFQISERFSSAFLNNLSCVTEQNWRLNKVFQFIVMCIQHFVQEGWNSKMFRGGRDKFDLKSSFETSELKILIFLGF